MMLFGMQLSALTMFYSVRKLRQWFSLLPDDMMVRQIYIDESDTKCRRTADHQQPNRMIEL